ncbi:hypothetical protein SORBI_3001G287201 [Sorghum bicolor]|uniref:Uncharacterized protein n=1 Tax=Sorghum bicolor TaxID=4558 RepID=A0A1Z5S826_SORBI|nr:hypothetical protein SORBI_3001G287201 [Sorghum bicolor]
MPQRRSALQQTQSTDSAPSRSPAPHRRRPSVLPHHSPPSSPTAAAPVPAAPPLPRPLQRQRLRRRLGPPTPPQRRARRPCANAEPRPTFRRLLVVVEAGRAAAEDGRARARPSSDPNHLHPRRPVFIGPFTGDEAPRRRSQHGARASLSTRSPCVCVYVHSQCKNKITGRLLLTKSSKMGDTASD